MPIEIRNVGEIPFDLKYSPDLSFHMNGQLSSVFPDDVGVGQCIILPLFQNYNFATQIMIIDDYLLQFSQTGMLHIYNIVDKKYYILNVCALLRNFSFGNWLLQSVDHSVNANEVFQKNTKAKNRLILYLELLTHFTKSPQSDREFQQTLGRFRSFFANGDMLNIVHGAWYLGEERHTWGHMALTLFRNEFSSFTDYHKL